MSNDPAERAAQRIFEEIDLQDWNSGKVADIIRDEFSELMPCGHPQACQVISAETSEPLCCGWCDAVSAARDAMTGPGPCGHEKACQFPELKKCTACEREAAAVEVAREECARVLDPLSNAFKVAEVSPGIANPIGIAEVLKLHAEKIRALNLTGALDRKVNQARLNELESLTVCSWGEDTSSYPHEWVSIIHRNKRIAELKAALGEPK